MGKIIAIITSTFFLLYIPICLVFWIYPDAGFTHPTAAVLVTDAITLFLVIVDPMVYIISHEKYRDGIQDLFKCRNPGSDEVFVEISSYSRTTKH